MSFVQLRCSDDTFGILIWRSRLTLTSAPLRKVLPPSRREYLRDTNGVRSQGASPNCGRVLAAERFSPCLAITSMATLGNSLFISLVSRRSRYNRGKTAASWRTRISLPQGARPSTRSVHVRGKQSWFSVFFCANVGAAAPTFLCPTSTPDSTDNGSDLARDLSKLCASHTRTTC